MINVPIDEQKSLLDEIVINQDLHARFLNTLALMELCGAQKISRLIPAIENSSFLLEHLAEEYRHAFFLRRLANKIAGKSFEDFKTENVFCLKQSRGYIRNLDRKICRLSHQYDSGDLTYLLSTYVIEKRALPFYTLYQSIIDKHQVPISVKSVISEEENHLHEMDLQISQKAVPISLIDACLRIEETLFEIWIKAIAQEIHRIKLSHRSMVL